MECLLDLDVEIHILMFGDIKILQTKKKKRNGSEPFIMLHVL